jgi:hypothetical protein
LEAGQLFLRRGPKLLNFLHQGLYDLHLLFGQLMRPRRPGPKDVSRAKFIEPESLADGGLVLGVEPLVLQLGLFSGFRRLKYSTSWRTCS